MKVYITKYLFTRGIECLEVEATSSPDMVKNPANQYNEFFHKGDWFLTEAEARLRAMELISNKLKSLDKQATKIRKLKEKLNLGESA